MGNTSPAPKKEDPKLKKVIKKESPLTKEDTTIIKQTPEEIIVKCSLEEMVRNLFKDYMIIWHDPNINNENNQENLHQLKNFCEVFTFTHHEEASNFIKETNKICHVITSGTNGENLIKEISPIQSVLKIYIFCQNKEYHSNWAKNYPKVSCVEITMEKVHLQIQENLLQWYKKMSSFKLNLPAFAPIFNDSDKTQMNHLHHYLKVIPKFKNRSQAKTDFLNLSKKIYSDSQNLKFIKEFEENYNKYNMAQILKWYTIESFLYKMINNCLRIATSDSIQYCRLLLKDIERAIKQQYKEKSKDFSGLLYRGAYLSEEEWRNLQENKNQEIEMHEFLSVSKVKNVALHFIESDPEKKVFITIIVPKGPNEEEQGFAEVHQFSEYPQEKEILFNVRSRFTILETQERYSENLNCLHLVLLYGSQGFRKFLTLKNPIQQVKILEIQTIKCVHCHLEKPEKLLFVPITTNLQEKISCFDCIVDAKENVPFLCIPVTEEPKINLQGFILTTPQIPFYGYECSICESNKQQPYLTCLDCQNKTFWCSHCFKYTPPTCLVAQHHIILETNPLTFWSQKMSENELAHIEFQNNLTKKGQNVFRQANMYFESHNYKKAEKYYNIYLEQNEETTQDINSDLGLCYNNLGRIYDKRGEYKKALEYHEKSLNNGKLIHGENHLNIAISYSSIGMVYDHQGDYKTALKYHLKAFEIVSKCTINKEHNYTVAIFYNNIGMAYDHLEDFSKALEYSLKSLEIEKSIHGENHPNIAVSYANIGKIYENQGDLPKALEYFFSSLEIEKSVHGEIHPDVATSYGHIGMIYDEQGDFPKALDYHLKALEILISIYGENHSQVAALYHNIGLIYYHQKENKKALECYLKALEIDKLAQTHPDLAISYVNIGSVYERERNYKQALEYYLRSLEIGKSAYGENHSQVAISYNKMASVYEEQKKDKKALKFYTKALDIRRSLYGENHSDVSDSYSNLGRFYENQVNYSKLLECHLKSIEIYKKIHGEMHPDLAFSYCNIASVYKDKGEDRIALEYLFKGLEIEKSIYGEDHIETARSYFQIGKIYEKLGDNMNTLKYYSKALHIRKVVNGENHPETMEIHNKILQITSQ